MSKLWQGAARLERVTLLFPLGTRLAAALALLMLGMGLELVGCCLGGTSSNVVALTARAEVDPSVVITTLSTLAVLLRQPQPV